MHRGQGGANPDIKGFELTQQDAGSMRQVEVNKKQTNKETKENNNNNSKKKQQKKQTKTKNLQAVKAFKGKSDQLNKVDSSTHYLLLHF